MSDEPLQSLSCGCTYRISNRGWHRHARIIVAHCPKHREEYEEMLRMLAEGGHSWDEDDD